MKRNIILLLLTPITMMRIKGNVSAEIIVFYAGAEDFPITVTKNDELRDH